MTIASPNCDQCPLNAQQSRRIYSRGPADAEIVVVGKAPDEDDLRAGEPFAGPVGEDLNRHLRKAGWDLSKILFVNAFCCQPPDKFNFTKKHVECCQPVLRSIIQQAPRKLIIALGNEAFSSIMHVNPTGVEKGAGLVKQSPEYGCPVVWTHHPNKVRLSPQITPQFLSHLQKALHIYVNGGDFDPADDAKKVLVTQLPQLRKLIEILKQRGNDGEMMAFDIETTGTDRFGDEILGIAFGFCDFGAYVPLKHGPTASREVLDAADPALIEHDKQWAAVLAETAALESNKALKPKEKTAAKKLLAERRSALEREVFPVRDYAEKLLLLREILEDGSIEKSAHFGKFDTTFIANKLQTYVNGYVADPLLLHQLIDENLPHGLKYLARQEFNAPDWDADAKEYIEGKDKHLGMAPLNSVAKYGCLDVVYTARLVRQYLIDADRMGVKEIHDRLLVPLSHALGEMELTGMRPDPEALAQVGERLELRMEQLRTEIDEITGFGGVKLPYRGEKDRQLGINPNSDADIRYMLFQHYGLPSIKKTDTGQESVDKEVRKTLLELEDLQPETKAFLEAITEYSRLNTIYGTFVKGTQNCIAEDSRVHSTFGFNEHSELSPNTGRLSCVSGDTLVMCERGEVPISDVDGDDRVLTHTGAYRRVARKIYKGLEEMVDVELESGRKVTCTRSHRVLSKGAWVAVSSLCEEDTVCVFGSTGDQVQGRELGNVRTQLCEVHSPRGHESEGRGRGDKHRRCDCSSDDRVLSGVLPERIESSPKPEPCESHVWEYPRREGRAGCADCQGSLRGAVQSRLPDRDCGKKPRGQRVLREAEHGDPQYQWGQASAKKARWNQKRSAGTSGVPATWDNGAGSVGIHRSSSVLPCSIRSVPALAGCQLPYTGFGEQPTIACRVEANWERPRFLGYEQSRVHDSQATIGFGYPSCSAVSITEQEASGLCVSRAQGWSGDRWEFPQTLDGTAQTRRREEPRTEGSRLGHVAGEERASRKGIRQSVGISGGYSEEKIRRITQVGVHGVWDIEVEQDHSYVAGGMIHHNSNSPNLQNVIKPFQPVYIPDDGHLFVQADYKALEVRIWCGYSGDEELLKLIVTPGLDFHREIGAIILDKRPDEVTDAERQISKICVFGAVLYMGSASVIMKQIGCTEQEANLFLSRMFARFEKGKAWIDSMVRTANERLEVRSMIGRVRHLSDIVSVNKAMRETAQRCAVNSPTQGLGSDKCCSAQIEMGDWIKWYGTGAPWLPRDDETSWEWLDRRLTYRREIEDAMREIREKGPAIPANIQNTIHDALLFSCREDYTSLLTQFCTEKMSRKICSEWPDVLPLDVDVGVSKRWAKDELDLTKLCDLEADL